MLDSLTLLSIEQLQIHKILLPKGAMDRLAPKIKAKDLQISKLTRGLERKQMFAKRRVAKHESEARSIETAAKALARRRRKHKKNAYKIRMEQQKLDMDGTDAEIERAKLELEELAESQIASLEQDRDTIDKFMIDAYYAKWSDGPDESSDVHGDPTAS